MPTPSLTQQKIRILGGFGPISLFFKERSGNAKRRSVPHSRPFGANGRRWRVSSPMRALCPFSTRAVPRRYAGAFKTYSD
jgi:hypothetical protein